MSMPKIEIPTIFELQTEKYGTLKVGDLRFGGVMKLVEVFRDLKNPPPQEFCATFVSQVVQREDGEEPIDANLLTEDELDNFSVQYLDNDQELFRRNDETTKNLKTTTESNIEYFTRVATDYLNSWSEKFSNSAILKVLKTSASLKYLTGFGVPQGLATIAKTHKSLSSLPAFPTKGNVEPVPVVMRSALESIDFSSIRNPAQESNDHLAKIVEHLEALPLKLSQDSSAQVTSIMEQVQKIADQGNKTAVHISGGNFHNSPIGIGEAVNQTVNYNDTATLNDLHKLVEIFETHIDELILEPAARRKATAQVATIKAQLEDEPDPIIISQAGRTLRNITEGAIGSLIATAVQPSVWTWAGQLMSSIFG